MLKAMEEAAKGNNTAGAPMKKPAKAGPTLMKKPVAKLTGVIGNPTAGKPKAYYDAWEKSWKASLKAKPKVPALRIRERAQRAGQAAVRRMAKE